jgi:hypothetical protein
MGMSSSLFNFLLANLFISVLIGGIIFLNVGYKLNRNIKLIRTGWIIIGIVSVIVSAGLIYLSINSGIGIVFLIFFGPLTIIAGLVVTAALGTTNLIKGYRKKDHSLISSGWTCLIIHSVVLSAIILLLVFFNTGVIRISLM